MLVMKFGGTSVGSGESIRQVAGIILDQWDRRPVVVTSAMSGVTDALLSLGALATLEDQDAGQRVLAALRERHLRAAQVIFPAGNWELLHQQLAALSQAAGSGPSAAGDRLAAWGELLAVLLVCGALEARGARALGCLEPLIVMGYAYGSNEPVPDMAATRRATLAWMATPVADAGGPSATGTVPVIPVIPGFISRTRSGRITTLGRGGSDYSATILAAALACEACWIYTDVDGVLTADPRVVPEARLLPRISAATATRLAFSGARVLHPRSVAPAARANIELRVRNTFYPDRPGTLIETAEVPDGELLDRGLRPQVVAGRRHLSMVSLPGHGLVEVPNLFSRLCRAIGTVGVEIIQLRHPVTGHEPQVIVDTEDSARVSTALDAEFSVEKRHGSMGDVRVERGLALCSLIGEHFDGASVLVRAQAALARARVDFRHPLASSDVVSFVVPESQLDAAVRCIHAELIVEAPKPEVCLDAACGRASGCGQAVYEKEV